MNASNMQLFRQALMEATCNVYERELAECGQEEIKCSRRHYAQMRKILGVAILPAIDRKMKIRRRVIAALIAAALLLTGCTAYAYGEQIREFIETVFEDYIRVTYHDGEEPPLEATISEYYTLGYVPEGYELNKTIERQSQIRCEWNNDEEYIVFEQYHVDSALFLMDNDLKDWEPIQIGSRIINYRFSGTYCYFWNDGVYAYQITTSMHWEEQELSYMIENLKAKE